MIRVHARAYYDSESGKHPTHVAHVTPMLRVGWATWVGSFPVKTTIYIKT